MYWDGPSLLHIILKAYWGDVAIFRYQNCGLRTRYAEVLRYRFVSSPSVNQALLTQLKLRAM
jgi:hypothetical protein